MNLLLGIPFIKSAENLIEYQGEFDRDNIDFKMDITQCNDLAMKNRVEPGLVKLEIEMVKKRTYEGKPIGTLQFIENIAELLGIKINTRPKGRPRKHKK